MSLSFVAVFFVSENAPMRAVERLVITLAYLGHGRDHHKARLG